MRKLIVAVVIAIYFLTLSAFSAIAQVKPLSANNHPSITQPISAPTESRARAMDSQKSTTIQNVPANNISSVQSGNLAARPRHVAPGAAAASIPTQTYRVGVGDILDIQIPDSMSTKSTLYTVMENGMLDYPLAGSPVAIAGLTTDAIAARLRSSIRVLDHPEVTVRVRDYASHAVSIIGFVNAPGTKILRREAVPLYVVLSEAMALPEASIVTVVRAGTVVYAASVKDSSGGNQLVLPGDVIKVAGTPSAPTDFFFAGGEVNAPGQKSFHVGLTLTQAILASGGTSRNASTQVRISRQNTDGRLITAEYNLQSIQTGKIADPLLQKGDRIEVGRN